MEIVVEFKNVYKNFKIFRDKAVLLKDKILFWKRNNYENRLVLSDISFQIEKGESVAFIGLNGAGKSTILKLISKIMYPDSGVINVNGKVAQLIELGAGFHPDMTGRENIYINLSIFGFNKKQADEMIDDIIEFSELSEFIDDPVRTYSSGMYMRLAFSVAINVKADILLIDEILAVGDIAFQKKCLKKLESIKKSGVTIVIVSHDLAIIEKICDKCIWINDCKIKLIGSSNTIIKQYKEFAVSDSV